MRKSVIAVLALCALALTSNSFARKTYTLQELEAMKEAGKLKGNERFVLIEGEGRYGLTGGKSESAFLIPSDGKPSGGDAYNAIAYDRVTTTRYLTTMAREYYGNHEFWPYIYEENKSKLGNPNRTTPGTMVVVPSLKKYGVNPKNPADIEKARSMGREIYARYSKN